MKLRVGFSKTNSLISKVIRWVIGAPFSHTYIRFYDEYLGMNLIAHADWPGVIIIQADRFDKENTVVEEFEFDLPPLKTALVRNLRFLGSRYDYLSILGWAWTIALRRAARLVVKNPLDDPKSLICVDFCIRVLNDAALTAIPVGSMNPKGLVKYLRKHIEEMGGQRFVFERTE
jgi:hypothetical protein